METGENVKVERDQVIEVLKTCYDPEIPVNIYELGLIYEATVKEGHEVYIKMTLTSPNCPAVESLPNEVKSKMLELPGCRGAEVEITFEPPWEKEMMSEEAKLELGFW